MGSQGASEAESQASTSASQVTGNETFEVLNSKKEEFDRSRALPLLQKSSILRLMAELVRSFSGCAILVTQHTFEANQSELINEVGIVTVLLRLSS